MNSTAQSEMLLPANEAAEMAVLGAVLLDNAVFGTIELSAEDFYHAGHRLIWKVMSALHGETVGIDPVTITNELVRRGEIEAIGGVPYLSELTAGLPRAVNAVFYAEIVREKAMLRRMVHVGHDFMRQALKQAERPAEILARHEDRIGTIRRETGGAGYTEFDQVPTLAAVRDVSVDWLVEGFLPLGQFSFLFGEPNAGKSMAALDLAVHVADGGWWAGRHCSQRDVLYLDHEMTEAGVNQRKILLSTGTPPRLHYWGQWMKEPPPPMADRRLLEWAKQRQPLVIFDSLIRFLGCDENVAYKVSAALHAMQLLVAAGATVLMIHHKSDKPNAPTYRGSSDLLAICDFAWSLTLAKRDPLTVDLSAAKVRHGKFPAPIRLELTSGGFYPVNAPAPDAPAMAFRRSQG